MSGLDIIIDPEVNQNTQSYYIIQEYLKKVPVKTIIEIGASSGGGTTEALIKGITSRFHPEGITSPIAVGSEPQSGEKDLIKMASVEVSRARFKNLKERYSGISFFTPYNISSLPLSRFPSEEQVAKFIRETGIHGGNVETVLDWLRQDIQYVKDNNFDVNGIQKIKEDFGVKKFDLAVIDGSEFLGDEEFEELPDCDAYFLDDIHVYKNWNSHRMLENDKRYSKIFEEKIRGGSSLFCKNEILEKYFI